MVCLKGTGILSKSCNIFFKRRGVIWDQNGVSDLCENDLIVQYKAKQSEIPYFSVNLSILREISTNYTISRKRKKIIEIADTILETYIVRT